MNYSKWHDKSVDWRENPVCVLFISRNKDNNDVPGFRERRESFYTKKSDVVILSKFRDFINKGRLGEFCRCYISVNERDDAKVRKMLIHELIDNEDADLTRVQNYVVAIAAKKECAKGKMWMFDLDDDSEEVKYQVVTDMLNAGAIVKECGRTPHGYYIIVEKGFDPRALFDKYPITLKRDDLKCIAWGTKD